MITDKEKKCIENDEFTVDNYLENKRNHPVTNQLLSLFLKEHYVVVSSQGLEEMKEIFDSVPLEDREGVFSGFLIELQSRGFNYKTKQFQQNVSSEDDLDLGGYGDNV